MEEGARDPGPKPELAWLPVDKIDVDLSYQRSLESSRSQILVEKIAIGFKWKYCQAILATPRGERWLAIDGQHRVTGAKRFGIKRIPAVVIAGLTLEDQADAFARANTDRVAMSVYTLHYARVTAGDPDAVLLDEVCRETGISIPRYPMRLQEMKPGQTLAVAFLGRIVRELGPVDAGVLLKGLMRVYGKVQGALRLQLLRATLDLVRQVSSAERPQRMQDIAAWLATETPNDLYALALRRKSRHGGPEWRNVLELIKNGMGSQAATRRLAMPVAAEDGDGPFIRPLTLAELMRGR